MVLDSLVFTVSAPVLELEASAGAGSSAFTCKGTRGPKTEYVKKASAKNNLAPLNNGLYFFLTDIIFCPSPAGGSPMRRLIVLAQL